MASIEKKIEPDLGSDTPNARAIRSTLAEGMNVVIRRGPFNKVDKVAAWCLAAVWVVSGSIGMGIAVVHMHWRLGFVSAGTLAIGALWAIAEARGRPLGPSFPRRTGHRRPHDRNPAHVGHNTMEE